jgi:hypothetical protein
VDLERGPLCLVMISEDLPEWKNSASGQENRINGRGSFFFIVGKKYYKYKKGLGNAHPAFCSTFL